MFSEATIIGLLKEKMLADFGSNIMVHAFVDLFSYSCLLLGRLRKTGPQRHLLPFFPERRGVSVVERVANRAHK